MICYEVFFFKYIIILLDSTAAPAAKRTMNKQIMVFKICLACIRSSTTAGECCCACSIRRVQGIVCKRFLLLFNQFQHFVKHWISAIHDVINRWPDFDIRIKGGVVILCGIRAIKYFIRNMAVNRSVRKLEK